MSSARDEVLQRIAAALGRGPAPSASGTQAAPHRGPDASTIGVPAPHPGPDASTIGVPAPRSGPEGNPGRDTSGPAYRTEGSLDRERLLDLLSARLADYRAAVRRTAPAGLAATVAAALNDRGARTVVIPPGLDSVLPTGTLPAGIELVTDDGLSPEQLDAVDGVITGAAVAIAETGTVVLDGSPGQGRRAVTLVPDYHLCIVHAAQVVELVPEAVSRLAAVAGQPLTWISGPSATSDIELSRVEGVHGPRSLEVILVGEP